MQRKMYLCHHNHDNHFKDAKAKMIYGFSWCAYPAKLGGVGRDITLSGTNDRVRGCPCIFQHAKGYEKREHNSSSSLSQAFTQTIVVCGFKTPHSMGTKLVYPLVFLLTGEVA